MSNQIAATDLGEVFFNGNNPLRNLSGVGSLVSSGVSNAILIAGVVLIITIIYSGISMLSSSGDAQQFERARMILTSAIVGFVIVVASWFIVLWIQASTSANITTG